jgi:hypothetical protein
LYVVINIYEYKSLGLKEPVYISKRQFKRLGFPDQTIIAFLKPRMCMFLEKGYSKKILEFMGLAIKRIKSPLINAREFCV